jgi:hypothetical protein
MKRFIVIFFFIGYQISSQENLKKEIEVPFPYSEPQKEKKQLEISPYEHVQTITIPFPNDKVEFLKKDEAIFKELDKTRNTPPKNQLPLENIIIKPIIEVKEIQPLKTISESKEIAKDIKQPILEDKKEQSNPKSSTKESNPKSTKEVSIKTALLENRENKTVSEKNDKKNLKEENKSVVLPNLDSKTKKSKEVKDDSIAPHERAKFHTNRNDIPSSLPELNTASSSSNSRANLAKFDQIRLFALERKINEAKAVIDTLEDTDSKWKGYYELAIGLENSAKKNKKLIEEAIPFHLLIITEASKENPILPKSLWALSHIHFSIGEPTQSLDHLSNIILNHKNSEYIDDAVYLSARIYEENPKVRNLERAKKYYTMFIQNLDKSYFKNSIYLPFVKERANLYKD